MPSTRAEIPRLGTVTLTGFPGRGGAVLLISGGSVVALGLVAFDDGWVDDGSPDDGSPDDDGSPGTAGAVLVADG
jgi:hypothetical protein